MKRATLPALVLALALPAVASAQPTNALTFDNGRPRYPNYIDAAECTSVSTSTITVSWPFNPPTGATAYNLYASDTPHLGTTNGSATPLCYTTNGTTPAVFASKVVPSNNADIPVGNTKAAFKPSALVAASNRSCSTGGDQSIYVCVEALNGSGTVIAYATGTVTLNVTPPDKPTGVTAAPGNGALIVSFTQPNTTPAAVDWNVTADPLLAASGATGSRSSGFVTTTSDVRIDGLTNGVGYGVTVVARSAAGNLSAESDPAAIGTPVVTYSFWQEYQDAHGRETGGCAGGPAGVASLGALAAVLGLLAVRRRS